MRSFTRHRASSPSSRTLSAEEAATLITSKLIKLEPKYLPNQEQIQFWAEKLIFDVLDYCHRRDFPYALIFTCVDLIRKQIALLEEDAAESSDSEVSTLPLSKIKMDDTEFEFDTDLAIKTTAPDNIGLLSDLDFDSIKPRLNLYRRVVSF